MALGDYERAVVRLERSLGALCDCWDRLADGLEDQSSKYVTLLDALNASLQASSGDDPANDVGPDDGIGIDCGVHGLTNENVVPLASQVGGEPMDQTAPIATSNHLFALNGLPRRAA